MPLKDSFEIHEQLARAMKYKGYSSEDFTQIGEPIALKTGKMALSGFEADTAEHGRRLFVLMQHNAGEYISVSTYSEAEVQDFGNDNYDLGRDRILRAYAKKAPNTGSLHPPVLKATYEIDEHDVAATEE